MLLFFVGAGSVSSGGSGPAINFSLINGAVINAPSSSGVTPGTSYHVYANDGAAGPVDYTVAIATVTGLSYDVGPLNYGSDWTFAVRAFDNSSLLEEQNVDARVRIAVGDTGLDLAGLPNAPLGLRTVPLAGGTVSVLWAYSVLSQGAAPTGFHVYLGTPTPDYSTPAATVPFVAAGNYSTTLTSLTDGVTYQVAVRAYNASGEEDNTAVSEFTAAIAGPLPVTNLTSTVLA